MQKKLIKEVYSDAKVDPKDVAYVEAHGTGTKVLKASDVLFFFVKFSLQVSTSTNFFFKNQVGDPQEVNSIADVFCKDRTEPLLIGSVKSNMGHSEPASGLCSVAKVLIAMEENKIPGNLHFNKPNPDIPALNDGRLQVV